MRQKTNFRPESPSVFFEENVVLMWELIGKNQTTARMSLSGTHSSKPPVQAVVQVIIHQMPRSYLCSTSSDCSREGATLPSLSYPRILRADHGAQQNLGGGINGTPSPTPSSFVSPLAPVFRPCGDLPGAWVWMSLSRLPQWSEFKMAAGTTRWTNSAKPARIRLFWRFRWTCCGGAMVGRLQIHHESTI